MYMYIVCMYHFPLEVHVHMHLCLGHHHHRGYIFNMRILKNTHVHVHVHVYDLYFCMNITYTCNCSYIYTLCTPISLQMRCLVIMYYGSLLSQWHDKLRIGPALPFTLVYSQLMPLVHNTIRYTCSSPTCTCWMYIHQGFICGGLLCHVHVYTHTCTCTVLCFTG